MTDSTSAQAEKYRADTHHTLFELPKQVEETVGELGTRQDLHTAQADNATARIEDRDLDRLVKATMGATGLLGGFVRSFSGNVGLGGAQLMSVGCGPPSRHGKEVWRMGQQGMTGGQAERSRS